MLNCSKIEITVKKDTGSGAILISNGCSISNILHNLQSILVRDKICIFSALKSIRNRKFIIFDQFGSAKLPFSVTFYFLFTTKDIVRAPFILKTNILLKNLI